MGFGSKRKAFGGEVCEVADSNIVRAEEAILRLAPPAKGKARAAWDRRAKPKHLDRIVQRLGLGAPETGALERNGFVVVDQTEQSSFGWAYHEIYQSELPVFISVDSILFAVYAAHDGLVEKIERTEMAPLLDRMLANIACALPVAAGRYPAETARDLDVYFAVARSLLAGKPVRGTLGDNRVDGEAADLVRRANSAATMEAIELFGRSRVVDFTQYTPRGHYTTELAPYFRAVMWLSRLELNLVSRSSRSSAPGETPDPRETPREDVDALALADLVAAAKAGADVERFEQVFGMLAGRREDIPLAALAAMAREAEITDLKDPDAADKLRKRIGDSYQRKARIHYMPQGSKVLPAITSLIGPRITADTIALRPLAHSETRDRNHIHAGDIGFILGNDRGKHYLADDLAHYPDLDSNLSKARSLVNEAPPADDLYSMWLDMLRALAVKPTGTTPSFMDTQAFDDFRLDTTLVGYAQLRHNHVLIAGQAYGEGGCEIPEGFVEPAPAVYDALAKYADAGAAKLALFDPSDRGHIGEYFTRLGRLAHVLSKLSQLELANQPLPREAQEFLGMVTEMLPYGSDGRPTYTGWYFDLFDDRTDAIGKAEMIADFFTSQRSIHYLGAAAPRMGVFVVDTGGGPRAMVGPVARGYEYVSGIDKRVDDEGSKTLTGTITPWASYAVPTPAEPSLAISTIDPVTVSIDAPKALGTVTLELLDHHRVPYATATQIIGAGTTKIMLRRLRAAAKLEDGSDAWETPSLIHVRVGNWNGWGEERCMDGCGVLGFGKLRNPTE